MHLFSINSIISIYFFCNILDVLAKIIQKIYVHIFNMRKVNLFYKLNLQFYYIVIFCLKTNLQYLLNHNFLINFMEK